MHRTAIALIAGGLVAAQGAVAAPPANPIVKRVAKLEGQYRSARLAIVRLQGAVHVLEARQTTLTVPAPQVTVTAPPAPASTGPVSVSVDVSQQLSSLQRQVDDLDARLRVLERRHR